MILLGSVVWGTGPKIPISFEYEKQRSGANMQYRVRVTVSPITSSHYFGYPIYMALNLNGAEVANVTLKKASPSRWSDSIIYTSDWFTVVNKVDGITPVSFRMYSGSGSSRNDTYAYTLGVDPAMSSVSAANGTLGVALNLAVTKHNAAFTHSIAYACGNATGTVCTRSSDTTVQWNADNGNTIDLAAQDTKNQSVAVTFTITTHNGAAVVGTDSVVISMAIPVSVKPSVSLKVEDEAGYFNTYDAYVQGWSKLKITATPTLAYGSPITAYAITADGTTYTTSPVTTEVIKGKGEMKITAKVTDNRSRPSEEASADIRVLEYSKPSVTAIAYRCNSSGEEDAEGAYMRIGFTSTIASLNDKNTATYTVKCGSHTFAGTGTEFLSDAVSCDISRSWSMEVKVSDDLDSTTKSAVIPIAFTLMDFYRTGMGVALGKVATRDGFDCAMTAYFTGDVYIGNKSLAEYIKSLVNS